MKVNGNANPNEGLIAFYEWILKEAFDSGGIG